MSKICFVIGAGETDGIIIKNPAFVIAADGGYEVLKKQGITPNITVGDFDSLGYIPKDVTVKKLPAKKDETDLFESLSEGMKKGYDTFVIYGGTGGRFDHTLANIQNISRISDMKATAFLVGKNEIMTVIKNGSFSFPAALTGTVSVFSLTDTSEGVSETGLEYSLKDATLKNTCPVGVSNTFTGKESTVSVKNGKLLIVWKEDTEHFISRIAGM